MKLFIENLKVCCIIGDEPWERKKPQEIRVDGTLIFDARRAVLKDDARFGIDYVKVVKLIRAEAIRRKARLIETLADHLAYVLKKGFHLRRVRVAVSKRPRDLKAVFRAESVQ